VHGVHLPGAGQDAHGDGEVEGAPVLLDVCRSGPADSKTLMGPAHVRITSSVVAVFSGGAGWGRVERPDLGAEVAGHFSEPCVGHGYPPSVSRGRGRSLQWVRQVIDNTDQGFI
jgi:hypothetical protein